MRKLSAVLLVALISMWGAAVSAATTPLPAGAIPYTMSSTGLVYITHTDTGTTQNADCPNINNGLVKYSATYTIKLAWNSEFKFALNPQASHVSTLLNAKKTVVHGSSFSYSGYGYDDNCQKVSYGPCTGRLVNSGHGTVFARLTRSGGTDKLRFDLSPFGSLGPVPSSCDGHAANNYMDLQLLSEAFVTHVFGSSESFTRGVNHDVEWNINRHQDCSQTGDLPGETDNCSQTTRGPVFLDIHPISN
jgi:hypothetical protein